MRALMKEKPEVGAVLKEIDPPKIGEKDLLVRVKSAAICGTDVHIYEWTKFAQERIKPPMVFGHEFAAEVVEVGSQVEAFKVGDRVAADTHVPCGHCFQCTTGLQHVCRDMKILGVHTEGVFSDYALLPASCAWKMDDSLSWDTGATMEPFGIPVHALAKIKVAGKRVGVFGCGPIGIYAQVIARYSGAGMVIGVEKREERIELARKMGTEHLLNFDKCDVVAEMNNLTKGYGLDVLVELAGAPEALNVGLKALRRGGEVALVGLFSDVVPVDLVEGMIYKEATVYGITGRVMWDTWWTAEGILTSGRVDISPVITHHFPIEEYEKGFELAGEGKCGKVVFTLE